jgi:cell division septum initiation protein DivIVA
LLLSLEELVVKSVKVPFSSKAVIDEERALDLLEALRRNLPAELSAAQSLLTQRDELLKEAQRQAEQLMADARNAAQAMVRDSELVKATEAEAERLRSELSREIQAQQSGADRYADEVLAELEAKIARALSTIQNGRQQLASS